MRLVGAALVLAVLLVLSGNGRAHKIPPRVVKGFQCIHSHEGSWTDPNAPYYGGLQMDWGFMATYGTWLLKNRGTADKWTRHQQLHVAYRAYKGWKGFPARGFSPWPSTRRLCGV